MSAEFDALTAQVAANETVETSAVALIDGIAQQLAALALSNPTPASINALATSLKTSSDALSAAILANTPATAPATAPVQPAPASTAPAPAS